MKRILSIFLVFAMIFSLAACADKSNTDITTENTDPPVIEETVHSKEFKDDSGKTVIKVKVTLPQITDFSNEKVKKHVNTVAMKLFEDAYKFAESNIGNASSFMKSMKSDKPWSKTVSFETTLLNHRYACFIIKESLSYYDSATKPALRTLCLDVKTGAECTLSDFATVSDDPNGCFETFVADVLKPALPKKFTSPQFINDEVLNRLDEIVFPENFYLTEDGMGFYIDESLIHEYLSGIYKITFTWEELSTVFEIK